MDEAKFIVMLWLTGNFWKPNSPNAANITEDDLPTLTMADKSVIEASRNFQLSDANMRQLVRMAHARELIADGDVGPATKSLAMMPRCPMPDVAPPSHASFHYGCPGVQRAVESYQNWAAATGSGSWPVGCDPKRKDVHSVVVSILTAGFSAGQKAKMAEVLALVEKCEAEMGQSVRHVLDGDPKQAQHDVRGENIPGGVIGYAYFPTPGTCNQNVVARIDNTFDVDAITLANLYVHEYKGHSDGLEHTNGGIMNPSINVVNPLSWKGDKHEATKRRFFGGVPINAPSPPPDDPIPTGKLVMTVEIDDKLNTAKIISVKRGNNPWDV